MIYQRKEDRRGFLMSDNSCVRKSLFRCILQKIYMSFLTLDVVNQTNFNDWSAFLRENPLWKKMSVKLWDTPWNTLSSK